MNAKDSKIAEAIAKEAEPFLSGVCHYEDRGDEAAIDVREALLWLAIEALKKSGYTITPWRE